MPILGRAELASRSRSGARSARNLDASEHAHMLSVRSERAYVSSGRVSWLCARVDRDSARGRSELTLTGRGGATPPQGPTQTVRWVPTFRLRGRRSPSHDDRLGRP